MWHASGTRARGLAALCCVLMCYSMVGSSAINVGIGAGLPCLVDAHESNAVPMTSLTPMILPLFSALAKSFVVWKMVMHRLAIDMFY